MFPVSSDPRGRVLATGPVWAGCGFWDRSWPALLGVTSNHLPRDQLQESVLWPVTALAHERAIWDRCYPGGHRGDHWLEQMSFIMMWIKLPCVYLKRITNQRDSLLKYFPILHTFHSQIVCLLCLNDWIFLMLQISGHLLYLCLLYRRYDLPGKDILYRGWSFVGPSVPARHVPGGGLFQSGLLSVPQHLWSPYTSLQCERTRGEVLVDITKPTAGCTHPLFPSAGQQWPWWSQGKASVCWLCRPHRGPNHQAAQKTPKNELHQGRASLEGSKNRAGLTRGQSLQHRRPATQHSEAEVQLHPGCQARTPGGARPAAVTGGRRRWGWAGETQTPSCHQHHCCPKPSTSQHLCGREPSRGQLTPQAAKNECWPLTSIDSLEPFQTLRNWTNCDIRIYTLTLYKVVHWNI